jgi:glucose/arabinose dehydrogenase
MTGLIRRMRECLASFYSLILVTAPLLSPAMADGQSVSTQVGPITVKSLASGLDHPWGMAFLPDGRCTVVTGIRRRLSSLPAPR